MRSRSLTSLLGIAWCEGRLHLVRAERARGDVGNGPAISLPLPFAELTATPGGGLPSALRAALTGASRRTRACIAALPPEWILCAAVPMPALPPEDARSFALLAAERAFPHPPEELQIAHSTVCAGGKTRLTLLAVRKSLLERFAQNLAAAGLRPVALTFALPLVPGAVSSDGSGTLILFLDSRQTVLLATVGGGVALLRVLESVTGENDSLGRELRISWEQLSDSERAAVTRVRLTGDERNLALADDTVTRWAAVQNLIVERISMTAPDSAAHLAATAARQWLSADPRLLQFLPPQPGRWQRLLGRYSSRKLRAVGIATAAVVVLCVAALLWQTVTLWRLRARWQAMSPEVAAVEKVRADIRRFRPWADTTPQSLKLLRLVSGVFPRTGAVSAKTILIEGGVNATVSGTAIESSVLLLALGRLRQIPAVSSLKLEQIRGAAPAQFTFKFIWKGSAGS